MKKESATKALKSAVELYKIYESLSDKQRELTVPIQDNVRIPIKYLMPALIETISDIHVEVLRQQIKEQYS